MWIIRNDEEPLYRQTSYREHPVYTTLLPANHEGQVFPSKYKGALSRLPGILVFYDTGNEIEYVEAKDFAHITKLVGERDPKKIAISAKNLAIRRKKFGDTAQLTIVTTDEMQKALGSKYASRTVDSLHLGILCLSIMGPDSRSRQGIRAFPAIPRPSPIGRVPRAGRDLRASAPLWYPGGRAGCGPCRRRSGWRGSSSSRRI